MYARQLDTFMVRVGFTELVEPVLVFLPVFGRTYQVKQASKQ